MIETAGRAGGLAAIARSAEHLIAGRETVGDQPAIEVSAASRVTEQLNPMRAAPGVDMIDCQAIGRPAASTRGAVVGEHLGAGFPVPAPQALGPLLRIRLLPAALLLASLILVRLLPVARLFLDLLAIRFVVAATGCANFLAIRLCPSALTLRIFHVAIIGDVAEFDDVAQGVRKRMKEIAVLEFEGCQIASLREYWASEPVSQTEAAMT